MFYLFRNPGTGQNVIINFKNVTTIEHNSGSDEIMVYFGYGTHSRIQAKGADAIFDDLFNSVSKGKQDEALFL